MESNYPVLLNQMGVCHEIPSNAFIAIAGKPLDEMLSRE